MGHTETPSMEGKQGDGTEEGPWWAGTMGGCYQSTECVCVGVCEIAKEETHFQKVKINLKVPKPRKK